VQIEIDIPPYMI